MPEISIIMSVYNGEDYLAETMDSIVNQTYKDWELIAINDCSTDSTAQILSSYAEKDERIKLYTNEVNLRLQASLNKAISLCSGKYIARMDADDICLPKRFERQYKFMEENPDVSLSSCRFMTVKNGVYISGGVGGRCDSDAIRAMLLVSNPILHPGVIARAEVLKEFKYDAAYTCTEDLELWTRLAMAGKKMAILPECLLIYRLHDKQITSTTMEKQCVEVLKIQSKYYGTLLQEMDEEMQKFYINGIYFRNDKNIKKYFKYAYWLKSVAGENFKEDDINYVLFEILAEYKRKGMSKVKMMMVLLTCKPSFLIKEFTRRKKLSKTDVKDCMAVAKFLGIRHTAGTKTYPTFE